LVHETLAESAVVAGCRSAILVPHGRTGAGGDAEQAQRARQLLEKAVAYYRVEGDKAFAAFSRQGEFIDNDLYVYVLDSQGVMLASGGPSVVLIGRDISPLLEPSMREQFAKALKAPESGKVQEADYRWKNWNDGAWSASTPITSGSAIASWPSATTSRGPMPARPRPCWTRR
jgi:hypothetical protein